MKLTRWRRRKDKELDAEIQNHLDQAIRDRIERGEAPEEARVNALSEFGNVGLVKETTRDMWRWASPERLLQDVRFGARMLLKQKGFTITATLTLALGIGANTAIFSVMDAVLLKKLPVRSPDDLVLFRWVGGEGVVRGFYGSTEKDPATGADTSVSISSQAFERFHEQTQTLTSVFSFASINRLNVHANGQVEMITTQAVSGDYFSGLGVVSSLGRMLTREDDKPNAAATVILDHRYWRHRFGEDPTVIGKVVYLNGKAFTIVGVTPPEFLGTLEIGSAPSLTIPMSHLESVSPQFGERMRSPTNWWLQIMGRLKPGVDRTQAETELTAILQRHVQELLIVAGKQHIAPKIRLESGSQGLVLRRKRFSGQFSLLTAIAGATLLLSCVNLASLLLSRAAGRQRELAVRATLGAGRSRIIRQLLTESCLLSILGGGLGLLFALWGKQSLLALLTDGWNEFVIDLALDWRAVGYTLTIAISTGLLFGLTPALRATRLDQISMLKEYSGCGSGRFHLSKSLVVAQAAISLFLLIVAGLFVRTMQNLNQLEAGVDREHLLIFGITPKDEPARRAKLYQEMTERIGGLPGVISVSSSVYPLLAGVYTGGELEIPGREPAPGEDRTISLCSVAPDFLSTMGIPILLGREFTPQDDSKAPKAVVISRTLAQQFFPGRNPLGERVIIGVDDARIIGVAQDAKYGVIREKIRPVAYVAYLQSKVAPQVLSFALRTQGDPLVVINGIRKTVQSIDVDLPLHDVRTQSDIISKSFAKERLFATVSSFFGLLALALVCIGLYGVMSHTVTRRTHELGVRMALGANAGDLFFMIMKESFTLVLIGLAFGLASSPAATRLLSKLLYGLTPTDPLTLALAPLLMLATALAAAYWPARRAARVDPMIALRSE